MQTPSLNVAIVGGGLAGLSFALALRQVGIQSTVFEARARPLNIGGAVMLSPNALKVLDKLGLYNTVKKEGYEFKNLTWQMIDGSGRERGEISLCCCGWLVSLAIGHVPCLLNGLCTMLDIQRFVQHLFVFSFEQTDYSVADCSAFFSRVFRSAN